MTQMKYLTLTLHVYVYFEEINYNFIHSNGLHYFTWDRG